MPVAVISDLHLDDHAPGYVSDISAFVEAHRINGWIYGHTHHQAETQPFEQAPLLCASIGYPDEHKGGLDWFGCLIETGAP